MADAPTARADRRLVPMKGFVFTRAFVPLFIAYCLGAFADNSLRMATIVAIDAAHFRETAPFLLPHGWGVHAGSLVSMAFTIPVLIFSILAGITADRVPRHVMIKILKIVEMVLMAFAAVCFAIGNATLLIFSLFLMGAQSAFFAPTRNAVMPQYYPDDKLIRANGYFNAGLFVAIVVGLGLGGILISLENGRVLVSATLISAAALGAFAAWFVPNAPVPSQPERSQAPSVPIPWNKLVLPMIGIGWFWMIGAAVLANLPPYARIILGGGENELMVLQVSFAVGAGLGSAACGIIGSKMKSPLTLSGIGAGLTVLGSMLVASLSTAFVPGTPILTTTALPLLLVLVATAAANGIFAVPLMSALQRQAPNSNRAKIMGISNTINGAGATLGALLIIPLHNAGVSPAEVFFVLAGAQAALFAFMLFRRWQAR